MSHLPVGKLLVEELTPKFLNMRSDNLVFVRVFGRIGSVSNSIFHVAKTTTIREIFESVKRIINDYGETVYPDYKLTCYGKKAKMRSKVGDLIYHLDILEIHFNSREYFKRECGLSDIPVIREKCVII